MIVKVTTSAFRGRAFGLNQSATQLAAMLGPVIGGVLGGIIEIRWIFVISGIMLIASAGLLRKQHLNEEEEELSMRSEQSSNKMHK